MLWNIDIAGSLNSRDSFPRRKFENRAPIGCRSGPILSTPTIGFELHVKVAEEVDLEMCSYWQLSEVQMVHDLDLDSTCRTSSMPKHVTVASRTTEIWPFEFCEISSRRNLNSRDSFSRRKFKNRALTGCSPGPILSPSTISFELHVKTVEVIDPEKWNFAISEAR